MPKLVTGWFDLESKLLDDVNARACGDICDDGGGGGGVGVC